MTRIHRPAESFCVTLSYLVLLVLIVHVQLSTYNAAKKGVFSKLHTHYASCLCVQCDNAMLWSLSLWYWYWTIWYLHLKHWPGANHWRCGRWWAYWYCSPYYFRKHICSKRKRWFFSPSIPIQNTRKGDESGFIGWFKPTRSKDEGADTCYNIVWWLFVLNWWFHSLCRRCWHWRNFVCYPLISPFKIYLYYPEIYLF